MVEEPCFTNRLIHEKSPYLLQHAHNPIDWYPWGEEAFLRAEEEGKPIFLSIGYATCHWCHVMEKESFCDWDLAQVMNRVFISIKVDREERPEVDGLYMEFAQAMMNGAGGWPLNMVLTSDRFPFFSATYLPPHSEKGRLGLKELAELVESTWYSEKRDQLIVQANQVVKAFSDNLHIQGIELPSQSHLVKSAELFYQLSDPIYGGWRGAPKFPLGYQYLFFLRYGKLYGDHRAFFLVERTLDCMQRGGIYDQIGGGFHRYSVDSSWLIPHFEKMLYDNALLARSYLEAWRYTAKDDDLLVCREILDYLLRELFGDGFYAAQGADSQGGEGNFYLWSQDELYSLLGEEDGQLFCQFYQVTQQGNFSGRNVLHTPLSIGQFAEKKGMSLGELRAWVGQQKERLQRARAKREAPFKDKKVLSAWNGLAIGVLAEAGAAFEEERYLQAARKAAQFLRQRLWREGRLLHRWFEGEASLAGTLDDYACLISGLITLFEVEGDVGWLEWAIEMARYLEEQFKEREGAFYQTDGVDRSLILRRCPLADGAEPSGNAVHCENLLRLYQLSGQVEWLRQAEDILRAVRDLLDTNPPAHCYHLINLLRYCDPKSLTCVVALNGSREHQEELKRVIFQTPIPHRGVLWLDQGEKRLFSLLPELDELKVVEGKTTLYLKEGLVFKNPETDLEKMLEQVLSYGIAE